MSDPVYFNKTRLERHRQKHDITSENAQHIRLKYCTFILRLCRSMNLFSPYYTANTAQHLFHKFFAVHSFNDVPVDDIAVSCVFLASKMEETIKKLKEIIVISIPILKAGIELSTPVDPGHQEQSAFYPDASIEIKPDSPVDADYKKNLAKSASTPVQSKYIEKQRTQIIDIEQRLLEACGFNFQYTQPHKFIIKYAKKMNISKSVARRAWCIVENSFKSTISIQFPSHLISFSCLMVAYLQIFQEEQSQKLNGVDSPKMNNVDLENHNDMQKVDNAGVQELNALAAQNGYPCYEQKLNDIISQKEENIINGATKSQRPFHDQETEIEHKQPPVTTANAPEISPAPLHFLIPHMTALNLNPALLSDVCKELFLLHSDSHVPSQYQASMLALRNPILEFLSLGHLKKNAFPCPPITTNHLPKDSNPTLSREIEEKNRKRYSRDYRESRDFRDFKERRDFREYKDGRDRREMRDSKDYNENQYRKGHNDHFRLKKMKTK